MNLSKKNFLIIGCQKVPLWILKESLKIMGSDKIILLNKNFFSNTNIKKNSTSNKEFEKLFKYKKKYNIIIGTSAYFLEANVAKFLNQNNIEFYCYVDSIINLEARFQYFKKLPNKIITLNKIIINQIKKVFKHRVNFKKFYNLNMPYQRFLKNKYSKLNRKDEKILYLTSGIGINTDLKKIKDLQKKENVQKKLYVNIHPSEDIAIWKTKLIGKKNIKLSINKYFYKNRKIKRVYGISTSALVNYKFAGFDVYYIMDNSLINNPIMKIIKFYKIKKYLN